MAHYNSLYPRDLNLKLRFNLIGKLSQTYYIEHRNNRNSLMNTFQNTPTKQEKYSFVILQMRDLPLSHTFGE